MVKQIWRFSYSYEDERTMKETFFMRVLFCKIHCPFMCFCKPSAAHLYTSTPLKLDVVPSTIYAVKQQEKHQAPPPPQTVLKSCIRDLSPRPDSTKDKKVQWMDNLGKELTEIREFESRLGYPLFFFASLCQYS